MPKLPEHWPSGILPRRLTKAWAAAYCGCSTNTFSRKVDEGVFSGPDAEGKFDRKKLDKDMDRLSGLAKEAVTPEDDWSVPKAVIRSGTRAERAQQDQGEA